MARKPRIRKTKLVATIGPACDAQDTVRAMIQAGMNVARLNFSHEGHPEHKERLDRVRRAARELGANVATMLDTKGLEIRTGSVENGRVAVEAGSAFRLYAGDRLGDRQGVSISYPPLVGEAEPGQTVLLDDGRIELRVVAREEGAIRCEVVHGGELTNHRGLSIPEARLSLSLLSEANRRDLLFAIENEMDYIAASFVRSADDVLSIRRFLDEHGASIPIIAKLESREAVEHLDEIVAVADGTMVARGDLGVQVPVELVPLMQKKIIRTTVSNGKPVITATQMLDSMERHPNPTRAEVSDVANAIFDGTSAVMLSGETARGRYPVEAVRTMARLALQAEASLREYGDLQQILPHASAVVTEAVSQAAITMANHLKAAAILTLTESGFTSRQISKYRPDSPILAVTSAPDVVRRLAMNWGVTAMLCEGESGDEAKIEFGVRRARELGIVQPDDVVIATAGVSRQTGSTNLIRVITVPA